MLTSFILPSPVDSRQFVPKIGLSENTPLSKSSISRAYRMLRWNFFLPWRFSAYGADKLKMNPDSTREEAENEERSRWFLGKRRIFPLKASAPLPGRSPTIVSCLPGEQNFM